MKVVTPQTMSDMESQAYREGASEEDFMEAAGHGVALAICRYVEKKQLDKRAFLLCGKGNNGGDAYVAGVHLLKLDYEVVALQLANVEKCSPLCQKQHHRFLKEGGSVVSSFEEKEHPFPSSGVLVDGLFGTGFRGKVREPYRSIIEVTNVSSLPVLAVDIPSGLNGATGEVEGEAMIAEETIFLGLPKLGFFLREGWNFVGKLKHVDFGLAKKYLEKVDADLVMLSSDELVGCLPNIKRSRHKYQAGYVVGFAGSSGMPGAAMLASLASLRGGAGIVRLLHPEGMQAELSSGPYELVRTPYHYENQEQIFEHLEKASSVFFGPGIGQSPEMRALVKAILPKLTKPCVVDADALNIAAAENIPFPTKALLAPHVGEMCRLLRETPPTTLSMEFLQKCQKFAEERQITLILKGGPSYIFHPFEPILVNPRSDPGMATAGSGDVLTGLLAALLAQGLPPKDAAALGVYLHGIAGEHAAEKYTSYGMIASDLIQFFPDAFRALS